MSTHSRALLLPGGLILLAALATAFAVLVGRGTDTLGAWWPAAGVGVLAVLVTDRPRRPAVTAVLTVGFVLGNAVAGRDLLAATLLGLADTAEVVVVVALLHRLAHERLTRLGDIAGLVLAASAGAVVAALGVGATYALVLDASFWGTVEVVGPAHGASVLVLAPLGMLDWPRVPRASAGPVALALVMGLALVVGFGPVAEGLSGVALTALPLPLLVWAAVRHGSLVVALDLAWLAVVLTLTALVFSESFSPESLIRSQATADDGSATAQVVQVYLIVMVLIALPLSIAMRERETAAARTRESERTFRSAFTRSGLPVLLCRWDGELLCVTDANTASGQLLGRDPADLVGRDLGELLQAAELVAAVRETSTFAGWSGSMQVVGAPDRRIDGFCSLLEAGGPAPDDAPWFCLHLVDLTARHQLQRRLEDERTYTRAVMDTASSLIVVTDSHGTVMAANPATLEASGFSEEELIGRPLWETLVPEELRHRVREAVSHPASMPRTGDLRLRTRSGEIRSLVFSHSVHHHSDLASSTSPVLVFSANDVTEARESAGMVEHLLRSLTTLAFIGTDLAGHITLFSAGAERLLGLPADQARGRPLVGLLGPVEAGDVVAHFPDLLGRDGPETTPATRDLLALPEGRAPVRVSVTSSPVLTDHGAVHAHLFVARDVTDTRRNQEILVNALRREREVVRRLQDLDRAKDDFVSTVSHELRTPMSSIIGGAEMLVDGMVGDLEPSQHQLVEMIARNGGRLLALADDLLALAVFDRDVWSPQGETLDLREVARESLAAVQHSLDGTDLTHHLVLPETPVEVVGEASHLERAVTNLLTNAVKFTPAGGRVHLEVVHDEVRGEAVLQVCDSGHGISEADLAHVFERFYRSPEAQQQAIQGSGLGLSIVKSIVESHGGHVEVRSVPGGGTTVTVSIPLAGVGARRT